MKSKPLLISALVKTARQLSALQQRCHTPSKKKRTRILQKRLKTLLAQSNPLRLASVSTAVAMLVSGSVQAYAGQHDNRYDTPRTTQNEVGHDDVQPDTYLKATPNQMFLQDSVLNYWQSQAAAAKSLRETPDQTSMRNSGVFVDAEQQQQENANNNGALIVNPNPTHAFFGDTVQIGPSGKMTVVELGDVDDDGDLDILARKLSTDYSISRRYGRVSEHVLLQNLGNGSFSETYIAAYHNEAMPRLIDFDNDGDLDVVQIGQNGLFAAQRNNNWSFSLKSSVVTGNKYIRDVAIRDVDGDGDLDVSWTNGLLSRIYTMTNNGSGIFSSSFEEVSDVFRPVIGFGDFDDDGDLDRAVAGAQTTNDYSLYIELSDTIGAGSTTIFGSHFATNALGTVDIDGDGDIDIVAHGYDRWGDNNQTYSSLRIFENDGYGSFDQSRAIEVGVFSQRVGSRFWLEDIDGDGDIDIAVNSIPSGQYGLAFNQPALFLNDGTGEFVKQQVPVSGGGVSGFAIGDMDGDGDLDVVSGAVSGQITINYGELAEPVVSAVFPRSVQVGQATDVEIVGRHFQHREVRSKFFSDAEQLSQSDIDAQLIAELESAPLITESTDGLPANSISFEVNPSSTGTIAVLVDNTIGQEVVLLNVGSSTMNAPTVSPPLYTQDLATTGSIDIDFSSNMSLRGVEGGRITAYSEFFGLLSTSQTFSVSGNSVSLSLNRALRPNEKLRVSVTSAVAENGAILETPYVFDVRTEATSGTGFFEQSLFGNKSTRDIAAADLDGDGDLDLVCANYEQQAQTILWNDGTGSFSQTELHRADNDGVAVGDIDNDGDVDILFSPDYDMQYNYSAVQKPDFDKVQVLTNNGQGEFSIEFLGLPFGTIKRADGIEMGDLDGDGDLDAVVARAEEPVVLWNDGSGEFTVDRVFDSVATRYSYDVKTADFDNDGMLDIVFANNTSGSLSEKSEIWMNNGNGSFTKTVTDAPYSYRVQVADFNNDGLVDVASVSVSAYSSLWTNNGDGTFTYKIVGSVGARGLGVGDFDGNGTQDIIQGYGLTNDQVLLNDGNANFTIHYTPYSTWSRDMAVADFNADGKLDVAISNSSNSPESILFNSTPRAYLVSVTPTGPVSVEQSTTITISFSDEMLAASLDGDDIDVWGSKSGWMGNNITYTVNPTTTAVVVELDTPPIPGEKLTIQGTSFKSASGTSLPDVFSRFVQVEATSGTGAFASRDLLLTEGVEQIESADMNGDGIADIVTYENGESLKIYVYDPATGQLHATAIAESNVLTFVLVDKNNDGKTDIITHRSGNGNNASVLLNNGDMTFATTDFSSGFNKQPGAVALDYNKDGEMDFLAQSLFSSVFYGQAGAGFNGSSGLSTIFSGQEVEITTMTADPERFGDLLWVSSSQIGISHGTPTSMRSPTAYAESDAAEGLLAAATGDANGDGIDEVVYSNKSDSLSILWTTTGIPESHEFLFPYGYNDLALSDFNGDGFADIVGISSGSLEVMLNTGDQEFEAPVVIGAGGHSLNACDVDGDGDLDIAFVDNDENLRVAFNNPETPSISLLTPNATTASLNVADLQLDGFFNWDAEVQITRLDNSGNESSAYTPDQTITTTANIQFTTEPGNFATIGTLTVSITDMAGTTSTTLVVSEVLYGRQDYSRGTGAQLVDVLANDNGQSIVILDAGSPSFGETTIVDNQLQYTPNVDFYGLEDITYTFGFAGGQASSGTLSVYTQAPDAGDNNLDQIQVIENGDDDITTLKRPRGAAVSADGEHVYVGAYTSKAVNHFNRNVTTGAISYVDRVKGNNLGLAYVTQIALSPDGRHLYTLSKTEYAIGIYDVDQATGSLTFVDRVVRGVDGVDGLKYGEDIVVSPDGRNVYTVSSADRKLTVFRRDLESGELHYVERFKDGQDGVTKMNDPRGVTVSPDGKNVYVAAYSDNAVSMFARTEETGELEFLGEVRDNKSGVDGLYGASGVAVSPDGMQVFATGYRDNAIAVFDRSSTGTLTFVERFKHGTDGAAGLNGAYQTRVARSGQMVFAAARGSSSVAMLERDPATQEVDFDEYVQRNQNGVAGMYKLYNIEVDPSSTTLFAMGNYDNTVAVFEIGDDGHPKQGEPQQPSVDEPAVDAHRASVHVFPQPASDMVTFSFGDVYESSSCEIVDLAGRIVKATQAGKGQQLSIPVGELAAGSYYAQVTLQNGNATEVVQVEFIVKR